jgi:hypothetical protein
MLQDVALCCTILQEVVLVLQIFQRGRSALRETGRAEGGCAACATPRAMPCVEYSKYPGSSSTLKPCRSRVLRVPLLFQYSPAMPCGEYSEYSGFSRTWPSASPSHPTPPTPCASRHEPRPSRARWSGAPGRPSAFADGLTRTVIRHDDADRVGLRVLARDRCGVRGRCVSRTGVRGQPLQATVPPQPRRCGRGATAAHICAGTALAPPTSAPGLGSPRPHLRRDWAHPSHICTETCLVFCSRAARSGDRHAPPLYGIASCGINRAGWD